MVLKDYFERSRKIEVLLSGSSHDPIFIRRRDPATVPSLIVIEVIIYRKNGGDSNLKSVQSQGQGHLHRGFLHGQ
jgi:hypothetical protein